MAIFPGTQGNDIMAWRSVRDLIDRLQRTVGARAETLLPLEGVELLHAVGNLFERQLEGERSFISGFARLAEDLAVVATRQELPALHKRFCEQATAYFRSRQSILALHAVLIPLRDGLVRKVVGFAQEEVAGETGESSPAPYCLLATTEAGRGESTLHPRPDYLLIHANGDASVDAWFERFAGKVEKQLLEVLGLRPPDRSPVALPVWWSGSFESWRRTVEEGLGQETGQRFVPFARLADLRFVGGDTQYGSDVLSVARERLRRFVASADFGSLARRGSGLPVALNLFGGFRVERIGSHRGVFNLEQLALIPLVLNVRVMAVGFGLEETGTVARIRKLLDGRRLNVDLAERLLLAYHDISLQKVRLELADKDRAEGGYFLNPEDLTDRERQLFRNALETVMHLQKIVYQAFPEYVQG